MKRELAAALLLLVLFAGSLWNVRCLDALTDELEQTLTRSLEAARSGDFPRAKEALDDAIDRWVRADPYTHIFIRHPEIDATSDAFFELKEALGEQDLPAAEAGFDKLLYHLSSIDEMEHPRLGSIL